MEILNVKYYETDIMKKGMKPYRVGTSKKSAT